jgi:D-3-phosphoglycerate dehydrogenase
VGLLHFDREVKAGVGSLRAPGCGGLRTLTCGIVGYGRIGQRTAHKLNSGLRCARDRL